MIRKLFSKASLFEWFVLNYSKIVNTTLNVLVSKLTVICYEPLPVTSVKNLINVPVHLVQNNK